MIYRPHYPQEYREKTTLYATSLFDLMSKHMQSNACM